MIVIGLNSLGHDTSAALIIDGKLMFAVEEERISRKKHTSEFPVNAIRECLKYAGADIGDIDIFSVGLIPDRYVKYKFLGHTLKHYPNANALMCDEMSKVAKFLRHEEYIRQTLKFTKEVQFRQHHVCHMASSFYLSNFKDAALFSIDGIGEIESSLTGMGKSCAIKIYEEDKIDYPHSLGLLYSGVTAFLGFRHHCDEGKVMGLAPYGDPAKYRKLFKDMVALKPDGKYELDLSYITFPFVRDTWVSEKFRKAAGQPRIYPAPLTKRDKDVAASLQEMTENVMVHIATHLHKKTKCPNLCISGGVALNCVANGIVLKRSPFDSIYVQPGANDAGVAIGAGLLSYYSTAGKPKRHQYPMSTYWGPEYTIGEIKQALKKYPEVEIREYDNAASEAAKLLADNKVLSWFNGRMEFGPRALGNRSILANPFSGESRDKVNVVKGRELWRPLCPSMLYEDRALYLEDAIESPFMILMDYVPEKTGKRVPAIVHVDRSTRPQTVKKEQNPDFYGLLTEFKKLTGTGVLLNTSLNRAIEPVVMTPENAIDCFLGTAIDVLVFNNSIIVKKKGK